MREEFGQGEAVKPHEIVGDAQTPRRDSFGHQEYSGKRDGCRRSCSEKTPNRATAR